MPKKTLFTEQLRAAILNADETRYSLSKATGIPQPSLSRFVHGERGLSLDSIDRLCERLGLELRPRAKRTKKGR